MELNLIAGSSPHLRSKVSTSSIMRDVIIALMPALAASIYFFGLRAFLVILVTVLACVIAEMAANKFMKKAITISDYSAVVTGILLAFNLPPGIPLWIAALGGLFAIVIVKHMFGGLGHNFVNPALAARAFLMASWPVAMTTWVNPGLDAVASATPDAMASATPLALIKTGTEAAGSLPHLMDLFIGNVGGCIGETSVLALLIGAAYLVYRRIITLEIPLSFIGTTALLTWTLGGTTLFTGNFVYHIFAGGLMLGAFFMATDYTTSPITSRGKLIMGTGCGLLTAVIRLYGGYPEGVSYSILLMNLTVPLIDAYTIPKKFGIAKKSGGEKANA
ncbi:MAG: Na+-transporting NADH:ubiquinone oxidoreductase subunit D [Candidatus Margulisiibacteriota bacterium]|nr:MAG: NADH:ubiquinone oxidoreductase [Candidatus Margulisbacteria bacterium GWD2_39_127]OGI03834.1 MAG: NADH:ubiquinone oxidoreductase [Candidatus Margulisbacteria bacterium GWF2_38_17]OGI06393.1 MAG: NADH:ubiquinone oxidoreductase [Candidatus Margulisbacteria bacterium GWE2_39_32]PZM79424.1 MAG: Na+-transporting NADH:ubiquinone oxidoreductase subunit D [Candidatus Margulisiibacteriota bacterium]HAR63524.1 Na+-transporting NADH:ubiquinone oxidoreductase subunit D [Candidatus Margulisiibacteri